MRSVALALLLVLGGSCHRDGKARPAAETKIRLWHTFQPHEAEALNRALDGRDGPPVEVTLLPFARGMGILSRILPESRDCPDLVRIDSTWLPGLARRDLLSPVPPEIWNARRWLPEAAALARDRGRIYGLPHFLDGLALLSRDPAPAKGWPPATLDELLAAARELSAGGSDGIDVRVDGYWFLAFLRARGGDVLDPKTGALGIDEPVAARALTEFAALFGPEGPAPRPPAPGEEARDEVRRFRAGKVAIALTGPWAAYALSGGEPDTLHVAPFPPGPAGEPAAPRGGTVFVVPKCARAPGPAWQLALDLTTPALLSDWARRFGLVPATRGGLDKAGRFARDFYRALRAARPLPRHPVSAEMFDDLTPAIAAVVAGDATADEALAGVARAWTRLLERHGIEATPGGAGRRDGGLDADGEPR